ncbi:hypothetical protein FLLO111716_07670 [Flavobacterium longum]|uniref:DUF7619 domain-containing protein n=1 Tax=Flavobacterium longum TaxID=1299340 RepID=UPI0039E9F262
MRKWLLLFVFISWSGYGQVVSIPDANFKQRLVNAHPLNGTAYSGGVAVKIDTNNDYEIQVSEAAVIDSLFVGAASIGNLSGISSFASLKKLDCSENSLTSLDVSALTGLRSLVCNNNMMAALDISALSHLDLLNCAWNNITSLDVSNAGSLKSLSCANNNLTTINLLPLVSIRFLDVSMNDFSVMGTLDVSMLGTLKTFTCFGCNLSAINVAGLSLLETLDCSGNSLGTVNTSGLTALKYFACSDSDITSLDLTGLDSLYELNCDNNQLTTLNVSVVPNLYALLCQYNPITTIDFSASVGLGDLYIFETPITGLDVSQCPDLLSIEFGYNPVLESVNLKNGNAIQFINFGALPSLFSFCADESEIELIQSKMADAGISGVPVTSYCSFHPGGAYNTISGNVRLDMGNNGCDDADVNLSGVKITIASETEVGAVFTGSDGSYTIYTQQPDQVISAVFENPEYYNVSGSVPIHFDDNAYHSATADFCATANGLYTDVEAVLVPLIPARPGFDATYALTYRNKGNQTLSGTVSFQFQDNILDFVSASVLPDAQTTNQLAWNYAGLLPFETRVIEITLNVNSPVETPAVNIGDELNFSATVNPVDGDETPMDNTFGLKQIVVGSFDPNDKHCMQGEVVSTTQIGNFLHYVINFENTGNFPAENVVIKDLLDADKFDISSLQVLSSSHVEVPVLTGNKLEFYFENINLVPNEYGYVAYKIKTKPTLTAGSVVTNKASIYFDFNVPVVTNTATTTFQQLGVPQYNTASVKLFPNPVRNVVHLSAESPVRSVSVIDGQGRTVWCDGDRHSSDPGLEYDINLQSLSSGIFFLRTVTDDGTHVDKIIKE